jgi:lysine-specific demethylase/histidyl-hydroxylase NO66
LENNVFFDLEWLIFPYGKENFFNNFWQKKVGFISSARSDLFLSLFNKESFENIIEFSQPKPPSIRLKSSRLDEEIPIPILDSGRINVEKIRKCYMKGYTLILNSVEDYDPKVAQLARSIETEMGARVQVNSYLTPPLSQGFKPHYDTHDVIVVQIDGCKLWKVYPENLVCPLNKMVDGAPQFRDCKSEPKEILLSPGDILYLPRGWIHEAETENNASLHLTFGIHPPLAVDLLYAALDAMVIKYPQLREALPVGPLEKSIENGSLEKIFSNIVSLYAENASAIDAAQIIDDQLLRRSRSGGNGHIFHDIESLTNISPNTRLQRLDNVRVQLVWINDETVALKFFNELVKGPISFQPAMEYILNSVGSFYIKDLPELEVDHQMILASSLISCGLCFLCD